MINNAYTTLGLKPSSSITDHEVQGAYRKLVAVHHPDAGGDDRIFRAVHAAYELLKTSAARRAYDAARQQRIVDDLVRSTARIVEEFYEACAACAPRMEERR